MIAAEKARELIGRLKILDKYPKLPAGEEALIEALQVSRTEADAEYFVKRWIREHPACPKPCDIYPMVDRPKSPLDQVAKYLPPIPVGKEPPPPEYHCNLCEDSGWFVEPSNRQIQGTDLFYDCAKRCPHPVEFRGTKKHLVKPKDF